MDEIKSNAIKGIITNYDLHCMTRDYKQSSPEEKLAYVDGLLDAIRSVIYSGDAS